MVLDDAALLPGNLDRPLKIFCTPQIYLKSCFCSLLTAIQTFPLLPSVYNVLFSLIVALFWHGAVSVPTDKTAVFQGQSSSS